VSSAAITQSRLVELLTYEAKTGLFKWNLDLKTGRGAGRVTHLAGSIAGGSNGRYCKIGVDGGRYFAHRLAFLWVTGEFPENNIDHIDGNPLNNAWINLRDVSRSVNLQNRRHSPSGSEFNLLGVSRNHKRYLAQISVNKKNKYLGTFDSPDQAHAAYLSAKRALHQGCTI
jgi:hypothetical protein